MHILAGAAALPAATIGLGDYVINGAVRKDIGDSESPDPVIDNLSGATYNPLTGTLFTVLNGPERIVELNLDGSVVRVIELSGFEDTEGIVHLGGDKFGIVEERRRNFVSIALGSATTSGSTTTLPRSVGTVIPLGSPSGSSSVANNGIEGVAYNPSSDTIYAVWERDDRVIRSFDLSDAESNPGVIPTMTTPFDASNLISPTSLTALTDIAGLHYYSPTDTLLVLSHENFEVIEVTPSGTVLPGSISLTGEAAMFQPEGITVGFDGTIYVVGEQDEFAIFVGPSTSVPEPSVPALVLIAASHLLRRRRS